MTREQFETALDSHRLWLRANGKHYRVRRNGRTKTWKRDSARFEIPIKWSFNNCERINNNSILEGWFRVSETEPT